MAFNVDVAATTVAVLTADDIAIAILLEHIDLIVNVFSSSLFSEIPHALPTTIPCGMPAMK